MYALLSYLTWRVIQVWPDGPVPVRPPAAPAAAVPAPRRLDPPTLDEPPAANPSPPARTTASGRTGSGDFRGFARRVRRNPYNRPIRSRRDRPRRTLCPDREIRSMRAIARSGLLALSALACTVAARQAPAQAPPPAAGRRPPRRPGGRPRPTPNQALATVNGEAITRGELINFLSRYQLPAGQRGAGLPRRHGHPGQHPPDQPVPRPPEHPRLRGEGRRGGRRARESS